MFYHSLSVVKKIDHLPYGHVYLYNNIYINNDHFF